METLGENESVGGRLINDSFVYLKLNVDTQFEPAGNLCFEPTFLHFIDVCKGLFQMYYGYRTMPFQSEQCMVNSSLNPSLSNCLINLLIVPAP